MTYINQIFGDETIREIIKEVYGKGGQLVIEPSGPEFEHSVHHVYYYDSDEEPDMPVFDRENANAEQLLAATSPRNNAAVLPPSPRSGFPVLPPSPRSSVSGPPHLRNLPVLPPSPRNNLSASPRNNVSVVPPLPAHGVAQNALISNNNVVRNVLNGMVTQVAANAEEEEDEDGYTSKICSAEQGYQNLAVDINDTLCQSYSLMTMLDVEFDATPSAEASREQKYNKQLSMINMYRTILTNRKFVREFGKIIRDSDNEELWEDTVDEENIFFIIRTYRTPAVIIDKIRKVLDIWQRWGWQFFVGDGKCEKVKKDGGKRKTRRRNRH